MRHRLGYLCPLVFVRLLFPAEANSSSPKQLDGSSNHEIVDQVPFELRDGHLIILKGALPGLDRKVNILIDTGATTTFVNRELARRVGLRTLPNMGIKSAAFGSPVKVERVVVRELQLGRRLITRSCLAADLPWNDIDIVAGLDILRATSLTIDYEGSNLVFGARSRNEASVVLEDAEGLLVVPSTIGGQTVRLAVDTGAHSTVIYQKSAGGWGRQARGEKQVLLAHSGGRVPARQITVPDLRIGNRVISHPTVVILEAGSGKSRLDGFLATVALGSKRIHFDFERKALSLDSSDSE
ncbi:MAG: hypothetical protein EHM61_10385 [Acidobacteria bacterium]|nr:MAG: hypothetical protein EHM61_10385 [Acidobacteriota bacterium]